VKLDLFYAAAALALVLALGLTARMYSQQAGFKKVVNESLATSEGYDQQFINLVNHLEDVLTTRASFPFLGGRDPMTGRRREVAALVAQAPTRRIASTTTRSNTGKPVKADTVAETPAPPTDKVRLTAIIADDYGQHTAIVMDGERSLSVDVGDAVGDRKVVRITAREVVLEDSSIIYTYSLAGSRNQQRK
jgi:hypothetical protein